MTTRQTAETLIDITNLQKRIAYTFADVSLLITAFTHASFTNERQRSKIADYERLEFLGDAILQYVISDWLYKHFPQLNVGKLTEYRARLVSTAALATVAHQIDLCRYVRRGKGERNRPPSEKLLADLVESLIGAIYLDSRERLGINATKALIERLILQKINLDSSPNPQNYKTTLQQLAQQKIGCLPEYVLVSQVGPQHQKMFTMVACINDQKYGYGTAGSKKEAQALAAMKTLEMLRDNEL